MRGAAAVQQEGIAAADQCGPGIVHTVLRTLAQARLALPCLTWNWHSVHCLRRVLWLPHQVARRFAYAWPCTQGIAPPHLKQASHRPARCLPCVRSTRQCLLTSCLWGLVLTNASAEAGLTACGTGTGQCGRLKHLGPQAVRGNLRVLWSGGLCCWGVLPTAARRAGCLHSKLWAAGWAGVAAGGGRQACCCFRCFGRAPCPGRYIVYCLRMRFVGALWRQ